MKSIGLLFIVFFFTDCFSQEFIIYEGKVLDENNKAGLSNVHIFSSENENIGTISNAEGNFILKSKKKVNTLFFSHLGYQFKQVTLNYKELSTLVVLLKPSNINLREVVIEDVSAQEVLERVIDRLNENHFVEPATYSFFSRIVNTEGEKICLLEEHTGYIKQLKNHNSEFALEKSRTKAFSKLGKEIMTKVTMVRMTEMYTDNLGKYRENYLKKGKFNKYQIKFKDDAELFGRPCFVLHCSIDDGRYDDEGLLYIDKENYGIIKKKTLGSYSKEITFQLIDGRYYLKSTQYDTSFKGTKQRRTTLYNLSKETSSMDFLSKIHIGPKKAIKFSGNFFDDYWDDLNFIPLEKELLNQINLSSEK